MTTAMTRSNATGRATRELLLITAEELFGRRGIDAVTLKEIGDASGQRNKVVTQYHFGDKDGLIAAIVQYRLPAMTRRQMALLELAVPGDVKGLARVMVLPLAEQVSSGTWFVPFMARLYANRNSRDRLIATNLPLMEGFAAVGRAVQNALPERPFRPFRPRFELCTVLALQALSELQVAMAGGEIYLPPGEYLDDLTDMVAGALLGAR
jgi:AcrR family transcriptional regulator